MRKRWFWGVGIMNEDSPYVMIELGFFWLDYRPKLWWPTVKWWKRLAWGGWNLD